MFILIHSLKNTLRDMDRGVFGLMFRSVDIDGSFCSVCNELLNQSLSLPPQGQS